MKLTNIQKCRKVLEQKSIGGILVSSFENIGYYSEQFHFSATEREALLFITQKNAYLFSDSRFTGKLTLPKKIAHIETSARSGAYDEIRKIIGQENVQSIGYEETNLTVLEYTLLKKAAKDHSKLFPVSKLLSSIRIIKSPAEIKKIKQACSITDNAFKYIQAFIIPGVTEIELADRLISFFKRNGAESAFPPIVAFGANAAVPHHSPTKKSLKLSDKYILFDFGASYNNYAADLSRTVFIGDVSNETRNQYGAVIQAHKMSLQALKNNHRSGKSVDIAARRLLTEKGYTIPHAVGHGIGIAVHESPSVSPISKNMLIRNMVITIEPGIYIPHTGGIRVEDTVLVTEKGFEQLTKSPKDFIHTQ
jgi:Xaa-Pro aminopeptidase